MRSHGRREAHGTHLCRPGPWAGPGGGMGLKISHAAHHMPACSGFTVILPASKLYFFKDTAIYSRKHPIARGPVDAEIALRWWCYCPRWSIAPMWWARSRWGGVRSISAVSEAFPRRFYRPRTMRPFAGRAGPILTLVHLLDPLNYDSSATVKRQLWKTLRYCRLNIAVVI